MNQTPKHANLTKKETNMTRLKDDKDDWNMFKNKIRMNHHIRSRMDPTSKNDQN